MNKPIRTMAVFCLLLFLALMINATMLQYVRAGALDNLIWFRFPQVAVIECKAEGEDIDLRTPQGRVFLGMKADGWPSYVVRSHAEVDDAIAEVLRG